MTIISNQPAKESSHAFSVLYHELDREAWTSEYKIGGTNLAICSVKKHSISLWPLESDRIALNLAFLLGSRVNVNKLPNLDKP